MKIYCAFVKVKEKDESYHFNEESAKKTVSGIRYTDRSGMEHIGAHWTPEQIEIATASMKFPEGGHLLLRDLLSTYKQNSIILSERSTDPEQN